MIHDGDPLRPHAHEPNAEVPRGDGWFELVDPDGRSWNLAATDLAKLQQTAVPDCFIVSTGHGTSGPFVFGGVTLNHLIRTFYEWAWSDAAVVSADGFGNRVMAEEVVGNAGDRPILLATHIDGRPMARAEGLVRLIVPGEVDDALRQVKWVRKITINK